jgi:hypothetical protein
MKVSVEIVGEYVGGGLIPRARSSLVSSSPPKEPLHLNLSWLPSGLIFSLYTNLGSDDIVFALVRFDPFWCQTPDTKDVWS